VSSLQTQVRQYTGWYTEGQYTININKGAGTGYWGYRGWGAAACGKQPRNRVHRSGRCTTARATELHGCSGPHNNQAMCSNASDGSFPYRRRQQCLWCCRVAMGATATSTGQHQVSRCS
jgi:hypothetical protein